jgi:putative endonuclease
MFQALHRRWRLWRAASLLRPFERAFPGGDITPAEIGELGERLVAKWLRKQGGKVLARNFASPEGGEVDIVCRRGRALTFVEVKTRTRVDVRRPADAVNKEKQRLIQRGARTWLGLLGFPSVGFRFDIAEVILTVGELPHIHLIENAFKLPPGNLLGR